ncbi:MAG TPA: 6-phospho-beta-glucosidase [Streptosporangiaceae bacterium]|nr:6-phospho-beta-glucosidase [Streptosporangiaceae bacterium]
MKLTVIGGGSTYTPELADGIGRLLPSVSELVLCDPDQDRLAAVGPVSARILNRLGHPGSVRWTDSLDDAAEGADAILFQLRVGGQAARHRDETWPLDCGCVGQETTGAGGLAKALRTVPLVLSIAERAVGRASPSCALVDFTNPVGIVTRALRTSGFNAIGLCNVAIGFQRKLAALLGVPPAAVSLGHVGLNHLTWERSVTVDGKDVLPDLLAAHLDDIVSDIEMPSALVRRLGMIPSYYLRYYYQHDAVVAELRDAPRTRAQAVMEVEAELLELYGDPALDTKPEILSKRGGAFYSEAAVDLLVALTGGSPAPCTASPEEAPSVPQVVNVTNGDTLPFLPADAVIEVPAFISPAGAVPLPVPPVEPALRGLISHVFAYEELALEAALHGSRNRVYDALLAHPLVGQYEIAECLTDKLLAENAQYLPWT